MWGSHWNYAVFEGFGQCDADNHVMWLLIQIGERGLCSPGKYYDIEFEKQVFIFKRVVLNLHLPYLQGFLHV